MCVTAVAASDVTDADASMGLAQDQDVSWGCNTPAAEVAKTYHTQVANVRQGKCLFKSKHAMEQKY
jgi:hypothetical protein